MAAPFVEECMRSKTRVAFALVILLGAPMALCGQQPAVSDGDPQKEADTAQALYSSQNMVGALPLYEDLHKRQPESNLYRERLAMCQLGAEGTDAEKAANIQRARQLLLDARAAG